MKLETFRIFHVLIFITLYLTIIFPYVNIILNKVVLSTQKGGDMKTGISPKEVRKRRRNLEFSQHYVATKTKMSQAELSLFERELGSLAKDKIERLGKFLQEASC